MTQQIININALQTEGAQAAFYKCNLNFTELYKDLAQAAPLGNAIEYLYDNSTSEPPSSGEIRFDAAQATATKLWASHTTASGVNIKQFLSAATIGSRLIIQDKIDNTNYVKFDVIADPVDKDTYWEFGVAVTASGGNLPNGERVLVAITAAVIVSGGGGGSDGEGTVGPPGPEGPPGPAGPQGDPGAAGAAGPQGDPGATGSQGPKGDTGAQGAQGLPGATGAQGPAGADSVVPGPPGSTGAQGPKGDPGAQGSPGAAGAQGPKGDTGSTGAQGSPGAPGSTGPQGPPGVVSASAPLSFNSGTGALSIDLSAYQPLDADLTSLAAASATNAIYYRSAANTWAAVTIGANLTFTGGTLAATGGRTGVTDGSSAAAGQIGEEIIFRRDYSTSVPMADSGWTNLGSITVTAGEWELSYKADGNPNATPTAFSMQCGLHTSAAAPSSGDDAFLGGPLFTSALIYTAGIVSAACPPYTVRLTSSRNYYMMVFHNFGSSTPTYGTCFVRARRVR